MLNKQQIFGKISESIAEKHLRKKGYKILERNYSTNIGEIDIIAKHKKTIVFIEVKARKSDRFGAAKYAVTLKKQKKISMVALSYLKKTENINSRARFDVVAINESRGGSSIEIIKNAFDLAYG